MYINFWYVACTASELPAGAEKPLKVMMLGQNFAVWRDTQNQVRCLSDTCSHRGGALADGRIRGDCVECPYHGWTFNGDGNCVRLPSLGPNARIPERTRVDAYPVQEKYGLVWVFLGDLSAAERPPIIDIPEWGNPRWRCVSVHADWKIDYKRSVENTMDPAHNEFTHPTHGFLGTKADYTVVDVKLEDKAWGTGFMGPMESSTLPQADMRRASGRDAGITYAGSGHHGPHCTWTFIHISGSLHMHNYILHTPIHEKLDRWYLLATRNNLLDQRYDKTIVDRSVYIAEQDQHVLEPMHPIITPNTNIHEFLVPADRAIARYREYCKEWEERGWHIDAQKMREDHDRVAYAIPSPARRQVRGWVLPAVPLFDGRAASAATMSA